ncbi:MAG: hypothetical protein AB7U98_07950 [Candidatus Nitrosocosmicus sp.]
MTDIQAYFNTKALVKIFTVNDFSKQQEIVESLQEASKGYMMYMMVLFQQEFKKAWMEQR